MKTLNEFPLILNATKHEQIRLINDATDVDIDLGDFGYTVSAWVSQNYPAQLSELDVSDLLDEAGYQDAIMNATARLIRFSSEPPEARLPNALSQLVGFNPYKEAYKEVVMHNAEAFSFALDAECLLHIQKTDEQDRPKIIAISLRNRMELNMNDDSEMDACQMQA